MHILGGSLRGRKLVFDRNAQLRPVSQKVRAAIFNILRDRILDAAVLDLFCGTGSVGLEALSRGAAHVDFVDRDVRLVTRNVQDLGLGAQTEVYRQDAQNALGIMRERGKSYGFVFVGAPYAYPDPVSLLREIDTCDVVRPGGVLIYEHTNRVRPPVVLGALRGARTYVYGQTVLTLYEREG